MTGVVCTLALVTKLARGRALAARPFAFRCGGYAMASKTCFVYRDGKIQEIRKSQLDKSTHVQTFGEDHDNLHATHVMDDLRQQHMIDSNRAENAYNKKRGQ